MTLKEEHDEAWSDGWAMVKIDGIWKKMGKDKDGKVIFIIMNPQPETVDKI